MTMLRTQRNAFRQAVRMLRQEGAIDRSMLCVHHATP
jgi:hypothetical protein